MIVRTCYVFSIPVKLKPYFQPILSSSTLIKCVGQITGIEGPNDPSATDRTVILPVHLLAGILNDEAKVLNNVNIHWGHKFISLNQDESKVTIQAESNGDMKSFHADFAVGCDGARSSVRKALFNDSFPGHTWDIQLVATNVCSSMPINSAQY